jgi:hypothetical protein
MLCIADNIGFAYSFPFFIGMAVGTRMGTFFLPYNFFTELFTAAAPFLSDYKNHNSERVFD